MIFNLFTQFAHRLMFFCCFGWVAWSIQHYSKPMLYFQSYFLFLPLNFVHWSSFVFFLFLSFFPLSPFSTPPPSFNFFSSSSSLWDYLPLVPVFFLLVVSTPFLDIIWIQQKYLRLKIVRSICLVCFYLSVSQFIRSVIWTVPQTKW